MSTLGAGSAWLYAAGGGGGGFGGLGGGGFGGFGGSMGQPIFRYGRPGGGVRPDNPTPHGVPFGIAATFIMRPTTRAVEELLSGSAG